MRCIHEVGSVDDDDDDDDDDDSKTVRYLRLLSGICDSVMVVKYNLTLPGRFALRAQSNAGE